MLCTTHTSVLLEQVPWQAPLVYQLVHESGGCPSQQAWERGPGGGQDKKLQPWLPQVH